MRRGRADGGRRGKGGAYSIIAYAMLRQLGVGGTSSGRCTNSVIMLETVGVVAGMRYMGFFQVIHQLGTPVGDGRSRHGRADIGRGRGRANIGRCGMSSSRERYTLGSLVGGHPVGDPRR